MHLGQGRDPPVLDTLDEPQLPQRPAAVEWVGHQTADQLVELATSSGCGHRDLADVIVDVEFGVLDQPWPVHTKRRAGHPVAQH